jgi:hypothetical protein
LGSGLSYDHATHTLSATGAPAGAALTKSDDTNVTLTLGGTPNTALLVAASLTLGWTGQLSLARGGTNANLTASNGGIVYSTATAFAVLSGTATANQVLLSGLSTTPAWSTATYPATTAQGDVIYSSAANTIVGLTKDANATRYLSNTGASNNPAWAQVALATGVSGQLPLANGGTNANLTASTGGIFYSAASAAAILSGTATANKVLMSGASAAPTWSTPTFPNASATAGKMIVSDGTNWVASTPTYPNASATSGKLIISDGTNFIASTPTYPNAAGTSGQVLRSDGTNFVVSDETYTIAYVVGDGVNAVTTGLKGYLQCFQGGIIKEVTLLADQNTTGTGFIVNIWKCTYTAFAPGTHPVVGDKITSATPPTITNGNSKISDTTLSSWTTTITAGDVLAFNVDTANTCTRVTVSIKVTR